MTNKMNKVWIVTTGCYSDYQIVGVFTSKESAELFVSADPDDGDIEEWSTDTFEPALDQLRQGRKPWTIHMNRDGSVSNQYTFLPAHYDEDDGEYDEDMSKLCIPGDYLVPRSSAPDSRIVATRWAATVEGAIKAVNETRAQLIATDQWPATFLSAEEQVMRPYQGGPSRSGTATEVHAAFDASWREMQEKYKDQLGHTQ